MDTNDTDIYEDIQQVPSATPDFKTELAKKLQELAPEAIADSKVDTKKLKELLDDDATDDSERFGLFWPGKKRAMRAAQAPTTATLKPAKEESKDWDTTQNLFIEGDNLEVLKVLQKHYHNKIKMIYIDPPYNTGKDFVYPDNYKEGLQSYLEFTKQVDEGGKKVGTNTDTEGRYHSNWLNMMYPRLKLARNLLTADGVIFISIDDHEQDNLKKLCNEIFGEDNYIETLVWKRRATAPNDRVIGRNHEYILVYARLKDNATLYLNKRSDELNSRYSNPDNDPKGSWVAADLSANGKGGRLTPSTIFDIINPENGDKHSPPQGKGWLYNSEKISQYQEEGRIGFRLSSGRPYLKRYLSEVRQGVTIPTIIDNAGFSQDSARDISKLFNQNVFDFPKPVSLMSLLVTTGSRDDDIIMDFFSGSATTAQAVMQQNTEDKGTRKYILVQLPEPTIEITEAYKAGYKTITNIAEERIRRAGEKILVDYADKIKERETPFDVGFKVYRLADSNFSKWQSSSDESVDSVQQRLLDMRESSDDNATQEDLLTEILLKLGLSLTAKAAQKQISGLPVWDVNNGTILAYLDEHTKPNLDQLRAIADTEPAKFVILEDAFQGDDELKTNLSQICKTNKIDLWTV